MSGGIRVIVGDGAEVFRSAVTSLLSKAGGFTTAGVADAAGVIAAVEAGAADVVLVDADLPPAGANSALAQLAGLDGPPVVVWSFDVDEEIVAGALRAGAAGFLSKRISSTGLVRSLRGAADGEAVLSREHTRLVLEELRLSKERASARQRTSTLSERELGVLHLVASGLTNRQISARLYISEFTAKRHVQNILDKLETSTRQAAAALYRAAFDGVDEVDLGHRRTGS